MTEDDYQFFCRFLKGRSGIVLGTDKHYLIESRLAPVLKSANIASLGALVSALRLSPSSPLGETVVSAMTTNETYFFRDKTPFERFTEIMLPALMKPRARERRLRIWCAAASTGQEPYSLAMALHGARDRLAGWQVEIIATDIDGDVLRRAEIGLYTQFEVQRGLPIRLLIENFEKTGDNWQLRQEIRRMVQFRRFNLLDPFAILGRFDIIFCRNVLIYFDAETKADILGRMARALADDGYLVLGAAETVIGVSTAFKPHGEAALYVPVQAATTTPPARPQSTLARA